MAFHRQTPRALRIDRSHRSRRDRHYILWRLEGYIHNQTTYAKGSIQPDTTYERSRITLYRCR